MKPIVRVSLLALALGIGSAGSAFAQSANETRGAGGGPDQAGQPETSGKPAAPQTPPPSIASSLGPLGDLWGTRTALEKAGVTFSLTYIGETLGNSSGGLRRGSIYEGRLDAQFDADLEKLLGWSGATFHTNAYQIHGHGLTRYYVGNLMTASGIEALPSTRLYELWLEQKLFNDKVAVRVGQLAADTEFLVSQYATLFVNATFGWPAITGINLPSGGPAYPLATPAARVKWSPTDEFSLLAAIFNGDPAGPARFLDDPDPQRRNRNGTDFRLSDPAFLIAEGAYAYNQGKDATGLPGTIKLGAWAHLGRRFNDQRLDDTGLSLADSSTSGVARRLRGDAGVYAVVDQMIYRVPDTTDQGIGVFARVSASPSDRNLISFYADGGVTFKGMIPGRPDDTFGVSVGYAQISDQARKLDRDARLFAAAGAINPDTGEYSYTGGALPVRSSEALIEVTYQAQIIPGWTVQPDFQYVFRPGGNVSNPRDPNGTPIKDAAIFGLRTTIRY
jgi:porin